MSQASNHIQIFTRKTGSGYIGFTLKTACVYAYIEDGWTMKALVIIDFHNVIKWVMVINMKSSDLWEF